jgi:hypothetical protein
LGATLQRAIDKLRESRHAEAAASGGHDRPTVELDSNSQALVADMFESARARIAKVITMRLGRNEVSVRIGLDGPGASQQPSSEAIRALRGACRPLTVAEGIQLAANPFRYEWDMLKARSAARRRDDAACVRACAWVTSRRSPNI